MVASKEPRTPLIHRKQGIGTFSIIRASHCIKYKYTGNLVNGWRWIGLHWKGIINGQKHKGGHIHKQADLKTGLMKGGEGTGASRACSWVATETEGSVHTLDKSCFKCRKHRLV